MPPKRLSPKRVSSPKKRTTKRKVTKRRITKRRTTKRTQNKSLKFLRGAGRVAKFGAGAVGVGAGAGALGAGALGAGLLGATAVETANDARKLVQKIKEADALEKRNQIYRKISEDASKISHQIRAETEEREKLEEQLGRGKWWGPDSKYKNIVDKIRGADNQDDKETQKYMFIRNKLRELTSFDVGARAKAENLIKEQAEMKLTDDLLGQYRQKYLKAKEKGDVNEMSAIEEKVSETAKKRLPLEVQNSGIKLKLPGVVEKVSDEETQKVANDIVRSLGSPITSNMSIAEKGYTYLQAGKQAYENKKLQLLNIKNKASDIASSGRKFLTDTTGIKFGYAKPKDTEGKWLDKTFGEGADSAIKTGAGVAVGAAGALGAYYGGKYIYNKYKKGKKEERVRAKSLV